MLPIFAGMFAGPIADFLAGVCCVVCCIAVKGTAGMGQYSLAAGLAIFVDSRA